MQIVAYPVYPTRIPSTEVVSGPGEEVSNLVP